MVNDQAFPSIQSERETFGTVKAIWSSGGMSKREIYAALSMQGGRAANKNVSATELAAQAVKDADALMAELAKGAK